MTERTALYVYALLPRRDGVADGVTGLDGRPLRLVDVPGTTVAALVHDGSPEPFEGDDDQVRRWVAEQSAAVTAVWERTGSALPMTFNVLVADEEPPGRGAQERLAEWVTEQAPTVTEQLNALTDRCELRVEVTVDRAAAVPQESSGTDDEGMSPGMRRLLAKQREQQVRDTAGQLADTLHAEIRARLLSVTEDYLDRGLTHRTADETPVLSAAVLVRRDDIDAVGTVLTEVQARHPATRVRFLGPWPPYSFTDAVPA